MVGSGVAGLGSPGEPQAPRPPGSAGLPSRSGAWSHVAGTGSTPRPSVTLPLCSQQAWGWLAWVPRGTGLRQGGWPGASPGGLATVASGQAQDPTTRRPGPVPRLTRGAPQRTDPGPGLLPAPGRQCLRLREGGQWAGRSLLGPGPGGWHCPQPFRIPNPDAHRPGCPVSVHPAVISHPSPAGRPASLAPSGAHALSLRSQAAAAELANS